MDLALPANTDSPDLSEPPVRESVRALKDAMQQQRRLHPSPEALHNLSGFMSLLVKINDRERIVSTRPVTRHSNDHQ